MQGRLDVSGESYRVLILPPLTTIRQQTVEKIGQFYDDGGMVVGMTLLPTASAEQGRNDGQVTGSLHRIFGFEPRSRKISAQTSTRNENARGGKAFFLPDGVTGVTDLLHRFLRQRLDGRQPD